MPEIIFEKRDGVAHITLNRPEKRNALSPEMVVTLAEIWDELASDDAIRVALLTGAGDKAFSSGGDLDSTISLMMRSREPRDDWERRLSADRKQLGRAVLRNATFFKPLIAAINGTALAGGAEIVLAADLRIMSSEATLGLTELKRGLIAGGGSLARLVAWADAMEVALVGEPITAKHALRIGLVNRVVPPDQVLATAEEMAGRLCTGAPVALAKTKEAMVRSNGRSFEEAFAIETDCVKQNAATEDAKEGPRAFMEKRPPVFTGR